MSSKTCKKELTSDELRQRGTFLYQTTKSNCDHPVNVEIKLTGATRRWAKDVKTLSNNYQVVPDLSQTIAYDMTDRVAASLAAFANPDYANHQIVSILTALNDRDGFNQILAREKEKTSARRVSTDDVQIGNLEVLVEAAKSFNSQPAANRASFPKTARSGRELVLACRMTEAQRDNKWLNITHLPEGKVSRSSPSAPPAAGDKKYSFVGEQSRVLISRGKSHEEVSAALNKALSMLEKEAQKGTENAGQLHQSLTADIGRAVVHARTSAASPRVSPVPVQAPTQVATTTAVPAVVSQLPPLNPAMQQPPMAPPSVPVVPRGQTMAAAMPAAIPSPFAQHPVSPRPQVAQFPRLPTAGVQGQLPTGSGTNL